MSAAVTHRVPSVTVVIPCYNYGRFLPGVVDSALRQRGLDLRVLVIDDTSSDDSASVARRLAEQHEEVDCLLHEVNRGHIATYNEGLGQVNTDYLVLLSADDLLAEDALTRAVELLERHPEVGFVYGYSLEIFGDANPDPEPAAGRSTQTVWRGADWVEECCRQGKNMVQTPEVVMRTSVYRAIGGYEQDFPHAADFYLWLRAAARADVGRVNRTTQAYYRIHGRNMHIESFPGVITDLRERRKAFERFFAVDGHLLTGPDRLRALARRGMASEALRLSIGALAAASPDETAADEFAAEATSLWPAATQTFRWRFLTWLRRSTTSRPATVPALTLLVRTYQDVQGRYRWRRWRRTGL